MSLDDIRRNWEEFASIDPMWAILTDPTKRGGKWDPEEFFASGRDEIRRVLEIVTALGVPFGRAAALDFGCGVGRLTQALCDHFTEAHGVDIAPSMIETARRFNRHGARCQYHVNTANDLRLFPDRRFDFIYSVIVLQHMPPPLSRNYVTEFVRVLAAGGLAVFQAPAQLVPARAAEINGRHEIFEFPDVSPTGPLRMEMHGIPRDEVERLVHDAGGRVVKALPDTWAGPQWESYLYVVTK